MQILLCAATPFEIRPALVHLQQHAALPVRVLVTGVGMVAATYQIARAVQQWRPDLLLQAGIAGSFGEDLPIGTVTAVASERIGDLGVEADGRLTSTFDMGLDNRNAPPWENGALPNKHSLLQTCGLPAARGLTINEITTRPERITQYRDDFGAQIESMEGAALHYVGIMEGIPFLQVRAISNRVGERDKSKWDTEGAIRRLNAFLVYFTTQSTAS